MMMTKKIVGILNLVFIMTLIALAPWTGAALAGGFVVDHRQTDASEIPGLWIAKAKADLHIAYNHTSHGSQLISGMNVLEQFAAYGNRYAWQDTSQGDATSLSLDDSGIPGIPDLSQGDSEPDGDGIALWAKDTYDFLIDASNYHVNVVMWSWCNIGGHDMDRYLRSMEWLIAQFGFGGSHARAAEHPVQFAFMTGHANGGGEGDSSDSCNQVIRQHCATHNRIFFDFGAIENVDPDGNYFLDKRVDDALYYDSDNNGSRDANWATEYLARHPGADAHLLTQACGSCAHSPEGGETPDARLNCVLKGNAVWALFARLAGWNPDAHVMLPAVATQLLLDDSPADR